MNIDNRNFNVLKQDQNNEQDKLLECRKQSDDNSKIKVFATFKYSNLQNFADIKY